MARSRNIKPGFYKNEDLVELAIEARLLFPGLWMLADREGRLKDRPATIKMEIYPADNFDVNALLDQLGSKGLIRRYQVGALKIIQIPKFLEHQSPHGTEKDSDLPDENGFLTVHERGKGGFITGKFELVKDSNIVADKVNTESTLVKDSVSNALIPSSLNPDSLFIESLIPSSLNPDSLNQRKGSDPLNGKPSNESVPDGVKKPKREKPPSDAAESWQAYNEAFQARYQVEPTRNATVNAQLAHLVGRIGKADAPHVIRFYLTQQKQWYVSQRHSVAALVKDAEGLHASWKIGSGPTVTQARLADRNQSNRDVAGEAVARIMAKRKEVENEC